MKAASIAEIRKELKERKAAELVELCLRLARYKKENKELLTYLLFEADDPEAYRSAVQAEVETAFEEVNRNNLYWAKKSIRKILRTVQKYIRYAGDPELEAALLLHYCATLGESGIPFQQSPALVNLYRNALRKAEAALSALHEDIQYEYRPKLEALTRDR